MGMTDRAVLPISVELLREVLLLPDTTKICGAASGRGGMIELFIEDPTIVDLPDGRVPYVSAKYKRREGDVFPSAIQATFEGYTVADRKES